MAFVEKLVGCEVGERLGELHSIHASQYSDVALKDLAVCVDFTKFPPLIQLLPFDVVSGPNDGQLALPTTNVGDRLWKELRESNGEYILVKATMIDGGGTIIQYSRTALTQYTLPYEGKLSIHMLKGENPLRIVKEIVAETVETALMNAFEEEFCRLLEQELLL